MRHSARLSNRLLRQHHTQEPGTPVVFTPKTPDAADHWRHTGVCPSCHHRAISAGRCISCGATP